jgi:hypothetical protein
MSESILRGAARDATPAVEASDKTHQALQALLKSFGIDKACHWDKVAMAVGGNDLNGNTRFITLEFHKTASDPFGQWLILKDLAQYEARGTSP